MIDVVVPQMSEMASEIVLVRWLKSEGDPVIKGEPLFEIDTDKYVVEIEAFEDGILTEVIVAAGSTVEPGQVVARLDGEDDTSDGATPTSVDESNPDVVAASPVVRTAEARVLASPKARRLARERGVDLTVLAGTGSGGLITSDDVLAASTAVDDVEPRSDAEPLSDLRRAIGLRMQKSKQTVPHFYILADVNMGEAVRLRQHCADTLGWDSPPTFTDLIVAACASALRRHPETNVRLDDGGLRRRKSIDIGIAVGLEDGLIVPVIEAIDQLELEVLSAEVRAAGERARNGRLLASDLAERSMVVSNLGMYGVDAFIAIVDPPDPMILAAGRVAERCVVVDGASTVAWTCTMTLSADHRVFDGLLAARFVGAVKEALEDAFRFLPEET